MRFLWLICTLIIPTLSLAETESASTSERIAIPTGLDYYENIRQEYFNVKVETQLEFCGKEYILQSKLSKKELKAKMKKLKGSNWERFVQAHKDMPKFIQECVGQLEKKVTEKCLNEESSSDKEAFIQNFGCRVPLIQKLTKIEKEGTIMGRLIAQYEKLGGQTQADNLAEFEPSEDIGLPSITAETTSDSDTGLPSITPGSSTESGGTASSATDSSSNSSTAAVTDEVKAAAVEKAVQAALAAAEFKNKAIREAVQAAAEDAAKEAGASTSATEADVKAAAESAAQTAYLMALNQQTSAALTALGECLSTAMENVPKDVNLTVEKRRAAAEKACTAYRDRYKTILAASTAANSAASRAIASE